MKKIFLSLLLLIGLMQNNNSYALSPETSYQLFYKTLIFKNKNENEQLALYQKRASQLTLLYHCQNQYPIYIFYLQKQNKTIIIIQNTKADDHLFLNYENSQQKLSLKKNSMNMLILDHDHQIISIKDSSDHMLYWHYLEVYIAI